MTLMKPTLCSLLAVLLLPTVALAGMHRSRKLKQLCPEFITGNR